MPNSQQADNEEYLTPAQAARIAYVTTKTLSRFADNGKIRSIRPGKHRRYLRSDIEALVTKPNAAAA